jgi:hypothetical protein
MKIGGGTFHVRAPFGPHPTDRKEVKIMDSIIPLLKIIGQTFFYLADVAPNVLKLIQLVANHKV